MPDSHNRLIRFSGLGVCFTLLLLRAAALLHEHHSLSMLMHRGWLPWMLLFCVALILQTSLRDISQRTRLVLLAVQSVSVIGMTTEATSVYLGYLLLITTWESLTLLPERQAMTWAGVQTVILALSHVVLGFTLYTWLTVGICIAFKCFSYVIVLAVRRESDARSAQTILNAELLAARELFAERSRSNERLRISREIHDVLGHNLTALSINLESALSRGPNHNPQEELVRAKNITRELLSQVREVVAVMRSVEHIDLRQSLQRIALGFPSPMVHINASEDVTTCEPQRAQVLIRCVQEIITNTAKHTRAKNLWIDITGNDATLYIRSHDDCQTKAEPVKFGVGLSSMRERFEQLGGYIDVSIDESIGFQLSGHLPLWRAAA